MDAIKSTFHIDWKIIIAQAINFAVVFAVLYIYALKPLAKLMKERGEKISKGIDDAKENALLVQSARTEHEKIISKARTEADEFRKKDKHETEAKRAEMIEAAKAEVSTIINNGKKMLEAEKVQMVSEAKNEIVSLTTAAVEKVISSKQDLNNL